MTIDEMQAWLEQAAAGDPEDAILLSFRLCLLNAETCERLEHFASVLEPSDQALFHLALGHFLAVMAIDELMARGVPWKKDPAEPEKVQ
jgi:hypothetical protein